MGVGSEGIALHHNSSTSGCLHVSILFCGNNGLTDYVGQLVAFVQQFAHPIFWKHFCLDDQPNPTPRFSQFLETNAQLMNEIRATLRRTPLFIIWGRRSSAANQLSRYVPTHSRVGQRVHTFPIRAAKSINRSRSSSEVIAHLVKWVLSIWTFHFSLFTLQFPVNVWHPSNYHQCRFRRWAAHPTQPHSPSRASKFALCAQPLRQELLPVTHHVSASIVAP